MKSSSGQVSASDSDKAQQIGKYGSFAVTGVLSDPAFFKTHDIRKFYQQTVLEFEAHPADAVESASLSQNPAGAGLASR
jgi:hypothetical protein